MQTQEPREALRLALVMNGGVSLAVWMGGVTQEIFLLTQASRSLDKPAGPGPAQVYRGLLNLTQSSATVDVISGTSAGGVNGAALAVALLHDGDFSLLRDVWRDTGSLQTLLRPALGDNPGSLLQGDDYFLPEIRAALDKLMRQTRPLPASEQPLELRLTTTLLSGHQGRQHDDLGTPLHDVDYRAQFHFRHLDDRLSCTRQPDWLDALARAARSTASFPFAFEPSKIEAPISATYLRTPYGDTLKPGARYVIDGGVLDNKPFRGALEGISSMPRSGPTRRVLAYVNPDPGDGPEGQTNQPMPELGTVLSEALFAIPQSQTVSDQLRDIRLHNDKVRRQRDSLLQVVSALNGAQLADQAKLLYKVYRQRRLVNTYGLFIEPHLSQAVSTLGRRTLNHFKTLFCDPAQAYDWLPTDWIGSEAEAVGGDDTWLWGLFPVEFATSVMINMLKLAETLAAPPKGLIEDRALRLNQLDRLSALWPKVNAIATNVKSRRGDEGERWLTYRQALADAWQIDRTNGNGGLPDGLVSSFKLDKLRDAMISKLNFLATPERNRWCKSQLLAVAEHLQQLAPLAAWAAQHALASSLTEHQRRRQAEGLLQLAALFENRSNEQIIYRLLQLEVVCYAFDDHESMDQDTLIELVQVSGNLNSPLTHRVTTHDLCSTPAGAELPPQRHAKAKLRGLELAHFGAFYKSSWRANDWTYGRLDGADRLVHTLLNPERLRMLYPACSADVAARIRILALGPRTDAAWAASDKILADTLCGPNFALTPDEQSELDHLWDTNDSANQITAELSYLDDPALPVPDTLPHCAAAIVRRLHLQSLRVELPFLIEAIAHDNHQGAEPGNNAHAISQRDREQAGVSARDAMQAIKQGLINDEGLLEQAGTDLFTRTVAHVTASVQNTVSSASAKLGPISWFFTLLKVPIQGFNLVAQGLTRQSRTAAALHGGMLTAGLVLVLLSHQLAEVAGTMAGKASGITALPTSVTEVGWLMLVWGALFTMMRSPRVSMLVAAATLLGVCVGTLTGQWQILPDWCLAWGAGGLAALGMLIAIILYFPSVPWLQWTIGLSSIPVFATWSTGHPIWARPQPLPLESVECYALGLVGVLIIAILQASPYGGRVERWARLNMAHRK